uniref:Uncharacterized protein TCIL3000_4_2970 n=1 Tax=Trypanosoma congolense (strain IL3000) TaxID=1068625 RepID=G0ULE9_TRYCI|nr:unnamed protein product [Trypanosoma congolense IL3000]
MYYLPPMALILAITHSALERIVWVFIVPVAQEMEKQPYGYSPVVTLTSGLYRIIIGILPFAALGTAVATLGHKTLNCFVESMVDSYSIYDGRDYPLLAARVQFMVEDRWRYYNFLVVLFMLGTLVLSGFHTDLLIVWPEREGHVVQQVWFIIFVEFLFVVWSAIVHKPPGVRSLSWGSITGCGDGSFSKYFFDNWWRNYICYVRYITCCMVCCFGCVTLYFHGPLRTLSSLVETLLYLLIPHTLVHAVLTISITSVNFYRSLKWLASHREAVLPVGLLALPYEAVLLYSMYYFGHHRMTVCLLVGVNFLLIYRIIDLAREFDVTKSGSVLWSRADDGTTLPAGLAKVLEEAHENDYRGLDVVNLGVSGDIKAMRLYTDVGEVPLRRVEINPKGAPRTLADRAVFCVYAAPRMLYVQNPSYLGGEHFRKVQLLLRTVTAILLSLFTLLVIGVLPQSAFPELRKWPFRCTCRKGVKI